MLLDYLFQNYLFSVEISTEDGYKNVIDQQKMRTAYKNFSLAQKCITSNIKQLPLEITEHIFEYQEYNQNIIDKTSHKQRYKPILIQLLKITTRIRNAVDVGVNSNHERLDIRNHVYYDNVQIGVKSSTKSHYSIYKSKTCKIWKLKPKIRTTYPIYNQIKNIEEYLRIGKMIDEGKHNYISLRCCQHCLSILEFAGSGFDGPHNSNIPTACQHYFCQNCIYSFEELVNEKSEVCCPICKVSIDVWWRDRLSRSGEESDDS